MENNIINTKHTIGLVNLGCDKNRIDSEIILGNMRENYSIVSNAEDAEIIIVNTCGFIESAKQESIDTILEMAKYKENYKCKVLVVTGCLSQRYGNELMELLPEVDIMLGTNNYSILEKCIENFFSNKSKIVNCNYSDSIINEGKRIITTNSHTAYLRIAEGCSNYCSYCIIPMIRGKYRSRKIENIIAEAKLLVSQGVKELILVAQDTTKYGIDLYGKKVLPELINEISKIPELEWIRILYCYPEEITDELISTIKNNPKVCKYLDIPLQHISDNILKKMRRRGRKQEISDVLNKLKVEIPDICLRTTLIVGFPGETEDDFMELEAFVKEMKFDKLGVFKYSPEEGTDAANMSNQISDNDKQIRENSIMEIQQDISKAKNTLKIGKIYKVLVDGFENNVWYGRSSEMSPEIDGIIYLSCDRSLKVGDFVNVKIENATEYDLIGVVCDESCQ